ncbi:hypothetical protein C9374_009241 [Naegleria lovaniensis]|uniref:Uncharacterized protein n=1 Tax=Naegleria lovaniensis TaxID=51637 RepID=A0AA88GIA4_NAELO|nr:uncharacterized protein C9374_009241 [Naegleria lovaniensis]KAG2377330.1 hypothetical protein C9374_009241 [Naegleria lovaniensis]
MISSIIEPQQENPLAEKYFKTIDALTTTDLEEIEQLLTKVSSPKLKQLLQRDLNLARSKLVTRLLNESVEKENEKRGYFVKKKTVVVEREIEVVEEDEEGFIAQHIKGYKEKVRSIKQIMPDKKTKEIRDALIRCKGREEEAMEGLLTGELPKRPQIPKIKVKRVVKETKEVIETEEQNNGKQREKPPVNYFEDITLPKYENNVEILTDRINRMKEMIDLEKKETARLTKQVEQFRSKSSSTGLSDWIGNSTSSTSTSEGLNDEEEAKRNRMYLPGEYDTLERDEARTFTFKPERTFSNEVSHIHFRVAESEFYRLCQQKSQFKVTEVKYIVTSWLVKAFEQARHNIAYDMDTKYSQVKPILTFMDIEDYSDDNIDWICKNNVKTSAPYVFTNSPTHASPVITKEKKIMLFLVLPGRTGSKDYAKMKATNINELKSNHSLKSSDGMSFVLFNKDLILPYYIVTYETSTQTTVNYNYNNPQNPYGVVRLDEEWKNIEANAQADKFMNDVKEFYQKALLSTSKERVLDPTTFAQEAEDPSPGSAMSGGGDFEMDLNDDTPTPNTATSQKFNFQDE